MTSFGPISDLIRAENVTSIGGMQKVTLKKLVHSNYHKFMVNVGEYYIPYMEQMGQEIRRTKTRFFFCNCDSLSFLVFNEIVQGLSGMINNNTN